MKAKRQKIIIAALIVLGLTFLVIGVLYQQEPIKYYAHSLRTWQEADSVAGYPIATGSGNGFKTAEFEPNLSSMTPLERYRLPLTRGFERPKGEDATASSTGLVLYTGNPKGYPDQVVLLGHRLPDDSIVQTLYTGLTKVTVRVGQQLPRGTKLGTGGSLQEVRGGTAIDLEREVIAGITLNDHQETVAPNRIDLDEFLKSHPLPEAKPDPLAIMQKDAFEEALQKRNIKTN